MSEDVVWERIRVTNRTSPMERRDRLQELGREGIADDVFAPFAGGQVYWRAIYGTHLRALRTVMGLTQEAFGRKCDLSGNAVSEFEVCKRSPNLDTICRIADKTGISPAWFLDDNPESLSEDRIRSLLTKNIN